MIEIAITPSFDHKIRKLEIDLQDHVIATIEDLRDKNNHARLKVHKLHGSMKDRYSAFVDYKHRIIFKWVAKNRILLLDFGDHSVYE